MPDLTAFLILSAATAFWANLQTTSPAAPKWMLRWRAKGKPWSCPVCMSFWIALALTIVYEVGWWFRWPAEAILTGLVGMFLAVPAVAMLSVLTIAVLDKLGITFYIPQPQREEDKHD